MQAELKLLEASALTLALTLTLKLPEATNDRDQEQDRRVKAETQADEYVFQRDLLDAELKAMEEKAALHYMGVNTVIPNLNPNPDPNPNHKPNPNPNPRSTA